MIILVPKVFSAANVIISLLLHDAYNVMFEEYAFPNPTAREYSSTNNSLSSNVIQFPDHHPRDPCHAHAPPSLASRPAHRRLCHPHAYSSV
ncbi:hypothetical protein CY34DRAFT_806143 [Suillus luteus UH-Slu-Lm8-n1]|uniref:Uncharacterized protein n=1 Tax=Suillus luteus UH-Slu-Lm8-n1 TaxID=930992 RepID=A0A0D0B4D0_9AGAM|nr:hypothetical protein CY34DRAFT_806143 [Suillus luteus UH-Slu-Lm8-n1]